MSKLANCDIDPRVLTTRDVINASRIIVSPGTFPCRVVLRDISHGGRTEYVVHTERLQGNAVDGAHSCAFIHWGFDNGNYTDSLERARELFQERARRL